MWSSSSNAWKRILTVVLVCNSLCWDCDWAPLSYLFAGLERPRPGWGSHEQTERTEDCVLSYLQRRPLDHPLSVQGHPGPHAEGAGWTAWTFHRRQGKACWLWYHHHFNHIIRSWFVFHDPLLDLMVGCSSLSPAEPEPAAPAQSKTGKYVPPSLRDGGTRRGESMQPNRRGGCK